MGKRNNTKNLGNDLPEEFLPGGPLDREPKAPKAKSEKPSKNVENSKKRKLEETTSEKPKAKQDKPTTKTSTKPSPKTNASKSKSETVEPKAKKTKKETEEKVESEPTTTTTEATKEKKQQKRHEAKNSIEIVLRTQDVGITQEEFMKCFSDAVKVWRNGKRSVLAQLLDAAQVDKYLTKEVDGKLVPISKNLVELNNKIFEVKRAKVKDIKSANKKKVSWTAFNK